VSPGWATFLFEAANFLLLAAVLGWLFFRPVRDALERRRSEIEAEQRAAESARAEAQRALEQARARRAELESSLEELRQRLQREAETERDGLVEAARAQAQRERETLKAELAALRRAQARTLTRDAAAAAQEIVVRLLREIDGPELEPSLVKAASRALEKLRASGALAPVVVESARALDAPALASLAAAAGVDPGGVAHRVDPGLVAGVRVLTARGLVDASAAGLATQAGRVLLGRLEGEGGPHG
jgi:F-type H+-transporting ATPase subunit b